MFLKPAFEVASRVIRSKNDEEDIIEDSEILRDVSALQPQGAGSHEIEHTDNATSGHSTDQSNLHSTMSPSWLNNLFLLYVHKQKTDKLDFNLIAKEFVSVNKRGINHFGRP